MEEIRQEVVTELAAAVKVVLLPDQTRLQLILVSKLLRAKSQEKQAKIILSTTYTIYEKDQGWEVFNRLLIT